MASNKGITVQVDLSDFTKQLKTLESKPISKTKTQVIGNQFITLMKELIARGISPIKGIGRFPAYKHAGDENKYPATKGKPARPVNLSLTGNFLNNLKAYVLKEGALEVGYRDPKEALKEKGHREGAGGQPARPTLPEGKEAFAETLQEFLVDELTGAIEDQFK